MKETEGEVQIPAPKKNQPEKIFKVEKEKAFYTRLVVAVLVIIGLYYIFSPYQNCKRDIAKKIGGTSLSYCIRNTSW